MNNDLISRSALLKAMEEERQYLLARGLRGAEHILVHHCLPLIDNAPTVDLWKMRQEATENALKKAEELYKRPKERDNFDLGYIQGLEDGRNEARSQGELISREALRKAVNAFFDEHFKGLVPTELIEYAEAVDDFIDNAPTVDRQAINAEWLKAGIEYAETHRPQGEWIPVSERLPEKTGYYLVTRKGFSIKNHVKRVGYDANTKRWSEGSIIAWQELPEPYKEGGEEK